MSQPKVVLRNPEPLPQGLTTGTLSKTVDLTTAAANFSIGTIPAGSVVSHVAVEIPNTITAATASKIGVGRLNSTADPDKYWLSSNLSAVSDSAVLLATSTTVSADEQIGLFACAADGSAAGTIGGGADDYVRVVIGYITAERF